MMFAILCRRGLRHRALPKDDFISVGQQFGAPRFQNAVFVGSCSSGVCENVSEKRPFNVSSYLIHSCGLSPKDAVSVSKKLFCIKSPEKPDAVLKLFREYGFTDAHIPRLIIGWPTVLSASPNKTLLPKLEFFRSIGVPLPVLAQKISSYPSVLRRNLDKSIIPSYKHLKILLGSDERVVVVFSRDQKAYAWLGAERINLKLSMLRERGVPESSIVSLFLCQPSLLSISKEKLSAYVDRASSMGFDILKSGFINSIRVFATMTESTLRQKMEVYKKCGWTESDIDVAFLRNPICMSISKKKIMANMGFLVDKMGCKPAFVAKIPVLLNFNLEKRIKPRCLVARILEDKGLKNMNRISSLLLVSEEKFVNQYIIKYEKDIPELLDIYLGKVDSPWPLNWVSAESEISK